VTSIQRAERRFLEAVSRAASRSPESNGTGPGTVRIADPWNLLPDEQRALADGLNGPAGAVVFQSEKLPVNGEKHPLAGLADGLRLHGKRLLPKALDTADPDGTAKVFSKGHDWVAEAQSDRFLDVHQDGVSIFGVLAVTGLWTDVAPARSAITFTQNLVTRALELRRSDEDAFRSLFDPEAISLTRKSDGAVLKRPVLYVRHGLPAAFFRGPGEQYLVEPGARVPGAARGYEYLERHTNLDERADGIFAVELDTPGKGILFSNIECVHGRSSFVNGADPTQQRRIAGSWWSLSRSDAKVPWGTPRRTVWPFPRRSGFATSRWGA